MNSWKKSLFSGAGGASRADLGPEGAKPEDAKPGSGFLGLSQRPESIIERRG